MARRVFCSARRRGFALRTVDGGDRAGSIGPMLFDGKVAACSRCPLPATLGPGGRTAVYDTLFAGHGG